GGGEGQEPRLQPRELLHPLQVLELQPLTLREQRRIRRAAGEAPCDEQEPQDSKTTHTPQTRAPSGRRTNSRPLRGKFGMRRYRCKKSAGCGGQVTATSPWGSP